MVLAVKIRFGSGTEDTSIALQGSLEKFFFVWERRLPKRVAFLMKYTSDYFFEIHSLSFQTFSLLQFTPASPYSCLEVK
jgi:hypothetical protein